jgi:hypothetical protein
MLWGKTVRTGIVSLVCLSLVLSGVVVAADVEPNDDSDAASPLVVGEPVRGGTSFSDGDYTDWYVFEVDEPGEITVTLTHDHDGQFVVRVSRPDGLPIGQKMAAPGTTTMTATAREAGTHRLQVFLGNGDYELLVEFEGESASTGSSGSSEPSDGSAADPDESSGTTDADGSDGATVGNGEVPGSTDTVGVDAADDFVALSLARVGAPAGATAYVDGTETGGGAAPHVEWYSVFPEAEELYTVEGIERASDGGYVLTASQRSDAESGTDSFDVWVVKTDDAGAVQWRSVYRTDADELPNGLIATADGGALVYGRVRTAGSWQSLAVKVDSTGTVEWSTRTGAVGTWALDATPIDGGFLLVGDGDVRSDSPGAFWAAVVASDGAVQWERTYDVPGLARAVTAVDDGYVLAGTVDATGDDRDVVVAKLTPEGDLQWSRGYGVRGDGFDDTVSAVVALPDGDVVFGGTLFQPAADGGSFGGPTDGVLLRVNGENGDLRWARAYGGVDTDYIDDVLPYEDGVVIVGKRSVDPGENEIARLVGASVGWIAAVDGDGDPKWMTMATEPTGGSTPIVDFRAGVVADDGFVVAGSTNFDLRVTKIGWGDLTGEVDSGFESVSLVDAQSGAEIAGGDGTTSTSFPGFGAVAAAVALALAVAAGVGLALRRQRTR